MEWVSIGWKILYCRILWTKYKNSIHHHGTFVLDVLWLLTLVSISSLFNLRFFCQLECIHSLTRECKRASSIINTLPMPVFYVKVKVKVKFTLEHATKAQRGSSFLNLGARWGAWSMSRSGHFTHGKESRHPLFWMFGESQGRSGGVRKVSLPTGIRYPALPARSSTIIYICPVIPLFLCSLYGQIMHILRANKNQMAELCANWYQLMKN